MKKPKPRRPIGWRKNPTSGPVADILKATGLPRAELAALVGSSDSTLERAEKSGDWPENRAVQSGLRALAKKHGVDVGPVPDEGGVFL